MTTTAYDTHFMASDIAFTDESDNVHLNIPFGKVKRIGNAVIGMAGCYKCMVDFTSMVLDYILGNAEYFEMPESILSRKDKDFIVMVYMNGMCLKISKLKNNSSAQADNITQIPTVIGSGSNHVRDVLSECPNAVVAVLEAIKRDKYTGGGVKYCSIRREDVHNLEINPMKSKLNFQVTGLQNELEAANEFFNLPENQGKAFHASTEVYCVGDPSPISIEAGMLLLKQGFTSIRDSL